MGTLFLIIFLTLKQESCLNELSGYGAQTVLYPSETQAPLGQVNKFL